jgi:hypothetical protein
MTSCSCWEPIGYPPLVGLHVPRTGLWQPEEQALDPACKDLPRLVICTEMAGLAFRQLVATRFGLF